MREGKARVDARSWPAVRKRMTNVQTGMETKKVVRKRREGEEKEKEKDGRDGRKTKRTGGMMGENLGRRERYMGKALTQ
jgi:hypothetical protein